MIYLISKQERLFNSGKYKVIPFDTAMQELYKLTAVPFDSETEGLDPFTKKILCIQLGNKTNQYIFDWSSLSKEELKILKDYFESNIELLGWNLQFDLLFLYHAGIYPKKVYDGMIVEQLIWLGYPDGSHSYSLQAAVKNYCDIYLDKTVRGKIINVGLTEEVIVYAANDVVYLEDIREKQMVKIKEESQEKAVELENLFLPCLTYIKYCGVKLDTKKWKNKMLKDNDRLIKATAALNNWTVDWSINNPDKSKGASYKFVHPKDNIEITRLSNSKYSRCPEKDIEEFGYLEYICFKKVSGYNYADINYQGDLFEGFNTAPICNINWSSSKQVIPLFEDLGFDLVTFDKKTKKKKKSVEAQIIKKNINVSPIAKLFLNYQEAAKVVSTYGQNWLNAINKVTGRIHVDFKQLGADTGRISSGGGQYKINLQNLPHDEETRACFVSEKGNSWLSADYQSQESRLIASVTNDAAMIDLFEHGSGDVHSLVAKMSYPEIIGDTKIEDISTKFHQIRQDSKGIEFAINYGGDFNTIANNKGISKKEAKQIYDNYMKGFPGIKKYQDYCRLAVMRDGYILLNPLTKHRAHIYDWDELHRIQLMTEEPGFWDNYRELKRTDPENEIITQFRHYCLRKSASEKQSINYRIQNRGAMCFKLASILLFKYIRDHNLIGIVKYMVPAHDEINVECPSEMKDEIGKVILDCMERGAKPFCTRVHLGADLSIGDHWIH